MITSEIMGQWDFPLHFENEQLQIFVKSLQILSLNRKISH